MGMFKEFKEFAVRGNVLDMAIGIIVGSAFGKIVSSVVSDLLLPPISLLLGKVNFTDLKIILKAASVDVATGDAIPAVTFNYGNFLQVLLDFLIITAIIFFLVKGLNKFHKKQTETPPAAPEPSKEALLLEEIRDLLKNKTN